MYVCMYVCMYYTTNNVQTDIHSPERHTTHTHTYILTYIHANQVSIFPGGLRCGVGH